MKTQEGQDAERDEGRDANRQADLGRRVQAALENGTGSPWASLIRLFESDPETFYQLACDDIGDEAPQPIQELATLARDVRSAIQESYEIEASDTGASLVTAAGKTTRIPRDLATQVGRFLRVVDGKVNSATAGKDYLGTEVSEAEMRFKLEERTSWDVDHARLRARLESSPLVLRISDEEISHLVSQPAYITHGLLNCARKTVLAPTSVFKGLKRGDECPTDLQVGWAFSGKPRQAFDNEGHPFPAPEGMVYLVYANDDGFVFDWDWVKENPNEPGYPVDWRLRFGNPVTLQQDAVLELPKGLQPSSFDATKACYSSQGDCIFVYITDDVAYATRINPDLTVFNSLDGAHCTGFKIKNVQRILEVDKTIEMSDAPGLSVSVDSVLLATLKRHPEGNVQVYSVLIRALNKTLSEPPKVRVPA